MESFGNNIKKEKSADIEREKGANIELTLHILRHGDKNPKGELEEYGRVRTEEVAEHNSPQYAQNLKIKSGGSQAGPKSEETGMQRSLETAYIYGKKIADRSENNTLYKSRPKSLLNYEDWDVLTIDPEYDYNKIFNKYLKDYSARNFSGKTYENLSEDEQKTASFYASNGATKYYLELDSEAAVESRKEVAGTFAVLIEHYIKMMQNKLESNQKFLFPLGSHTGTIEPFLAETVIWKNKDGDEIHGATLDEIGGILKPSEGFDIILKTNQNGKLEQVRIRFDDKTRLGGEVHLDMQKIDELASFYNELHKDNKKGNE